MEMHRGLRTLWTAGALALALPAAAPARAQVSAAAPAPAQEAAGFVRALVDDLAEVAESGGAAPEREARLRAIVGSRLATDRIGRFLLGGSRAAATPEQLARYEALTPRFVAGEFAERIDELAAQNPRIGEAQLRGAREARVRSTFRRKRTGAPVTVDWRLVRTGEGWRLFDVYVNGVSRLVIRREEFASVVRRQGFPALLRFIEQRTS